MKKTLLMRLLAIVLCMTMLVTVMPIFALAEDLTLYIGVSESTGKADQECFVSVENTITDGTTDSFVTGWNIVEGNVVFEERITLPENVSIILADGATLTAKKGIAVAETGNFSVYAQSTDEDTMGKLIVPEGVEGNCSGIGSNEEKACGDILIYGGFVTVTGGEYGAGIGSGYGGDCGNIAIYGGVVTASGGFGAAGIGSGNYEASSGSITITDGIVKGRGGNAATGIGTGFNSSCGDITISGGNVIAQGAGYGSGIGVGNGTNAFCNKVSITGGYIKASTEIDDNYIEAKQVSIDSSFESKYTADSMYINCIPFEKTEADCTNNGALAYFKDSINGIYYTDFPFTEDVLIGDADALDAWKAEGGAGHKENPFGHDWQYQDDAKHICQRCKATEAHTDVNEDSLCDVCGATITTYLDYNETTGQADLSRTVVVNNIITDGTTDSFVTGWNIVEGNVVFEERITLPENVNLILADGATLTAKKGITVAENGDFAIYAQSNNPDMMGKLIVPEGAEDNYSGIGSDYGQNCGSISIYSGCVTVNGGYNAAGIGSGYTGNCASVTIYSGYVTANGGYGAAGIGSGFGAHSSCYKVTISGGHIKATARPFDNNIEAEEVLIDDSLVSLVEGNSRYVNCKVSAVEPTCTDSGFLEYFIDPATCCYYTEFPFSEEGAIGGNTALAIWKAEGGDGYIAPLGHIWQYYDMGNHTCQRCKASEAHTDGNEDSLCDMCGAKHTFYLEYNEISGQVDLPQSVWANVIADGTTDSFVQGWNIVEGNVTFEERIVLPANVSLILADGATLTAKKGITVAKNGNFAICAQSSDKETMGKLIVPDGVEDKYPGIGSSDEEDCGDITIRGGVVTVAGGVTGAGIGSGFNRNCGNIGISAGFVTAQGGYGAAGIGSGEGADCGRVMISGGTVTASSGYGAAGIGSGLVSSCEGVVMSGGTVIAQGGERAAGIGSGYASSCGRVSLSAAVVKATAGGSVADPIGSGELADPEVEVNMLLARSSTRTDNVQYVNCELFPETEADCSTIGALAYFRDSVRGLYYTDFPFTPEVLIGDDDALSAWKGEGGAGHKENAWGHNLTHVAGDTHTCARCGLVENHMDENKDGMCDVCSVPLTMHLGYNETTGKADRVCYAYVEHVIDEVTDSFASGWNIVKGNVTFDERITLPGEVHLILEDGATLTAKKGITVAGNGDFAIYAQSTDESTMGKLIVPESVDAHNAGIGPIEGGVCGNISIYGGKITAYGGESAAGIGGAYGDSEHTCGNVTIYGGIVNAYGGKSGSGIGVGEKATCKKVIIKGGIVNAFGGLNGAGIGGSYYGIEISSGRVTAVGGDNSAGIGSGYGTGYCNGVDITGGYIKAVAGNKDAQPIGGAAMSGAVVVTIDPLCTTVKKRTVEQYVNYEPVDAVEPTCTENGTLAYVKDSISGNYYTEFPFTEDGLIGDASAFAAWSAEDGDGYIPALGHDLQYVDGSTHKCTRCELVDNHIDWNKDMICDLCNEVIPMYLDYDSNTGKVDMESLALDATMIDDSSDHFVTGWNIVKGDVVFEERIVLPENMKLILANGATLTAKKGITVSENGNFAIYAQSNDMKTAGKLIVPENGVNTFWAGIGSEAYGKCGNIAIYGGNISSCGGLSSGSGIGSGSSGECGSIKICGGFVTARGGTGIGSGVNGSCQAINISGGVVTAEGEHGCAGIGSGFGSLASCGPVLITGGYIKATAEEDCEPIGKSSNSSSVDVTIDEWTCTSVMYGTVTYVNYEAYATVEPTCSLVGTKAYFQDYVNGNYYTAFPFTEDGLIGDADAFAAWKAEGGAGYLPLLPYHTDENEDGICDVCENTLTTYLDYNESTGKVDIERTVLAQVNVIDDPSDPFVTGWNIVKGEVRFGNYNRIVLPKDVKLILADGATLVPNDGIAVATDGGFSIYAQSNDPATMGKIKMSSAASSYEAGIGSEKGRNCGKISIYGGTLTIRGGYHGAAIGADEESSCAGVEIFGGNVTAYSGGNAPGIGSGYGSSSSCDHISIYGGNVTATGDFYGTGIGSGYVAKCGLITISGGNVTATSGPDRCAGIGAGCSGSCDGISITGGYIKATAGPEAEAIGSGWRCTMGSVSIDSSCTSIMKDGSQYINYEPFAKVESTCVAAGTLAYFKDYVNGSYYTEFPFAEEGLIGNDQALSAWKAQGGDGYLAQISHTDENEDGKCDVCENTLPIYLDYNESTGEVDAEKTVLDLFNVVDDSSDSFMTGWNVVKGNVEFENRIELPKNVQLILEEGATLTAKKGITVATDGDLSIYAQSNDADTMGKLIVPASEESFEAGIGSAENGECGNITIYGGMLNVQGGYQGAGIGCSNHGSCDVIAIYGGEIMAQGGDSGGAGIGSGSYGSCNEVMISGGVVTAQVTNYGAGIGSGSYGSCGEVTIAGGVVTAQGGMNASGIGGGFGGSCTKVTILKGYIKATGAENAESIGAGYSGDEVPVSIDDSCTSLMKDGSQFINYEPFAEIKPTCIKSGIAAYYKDCVSDNYYMEFPFTEAGLIGDETALATWKAQGGDGYLPMVSHIDENEDEICDVCTAIHVNYLDYNATTGKVDKECELWSTNIIGDKQIVFNSGWNVVKENVTFEDRITLPADVKLILMDGTTLTAKKGITVASDGGFAIYAQSNDKDTMGKLIVPEGVDQYNAGIGSLGGSGQCGSIAIYGGLVTAYGGRNAAGIGSGGVDSSCNGITIYGGIITATGGYSGAGIGSGRTNCSCSNIAVFGGVVATQGGYQGAGIGSGDNKSSCGDITISGGYVKATAGFGANPIGAGNDSSAGTVLIDSSLISVRDGDTLYINYKFLNREPTCTESGFEAYYIDPTSDTYYSSLSFADDALIGDAKALDAWKAENGAGYIAPLGHDWQIVDEINHKCARCEAVAAHTGVDDFICDECGGVLLETAIAVTKAQGEAKAALTSAAGENPSNTLASILNDACAAVDMAMTLDKVANAKAQGMSAIENQKETELEARRAQILPECESILASDDCSDMVKSMVREFVKKLNMAENLQDLEYTVNMYAPAIRLRMARDTWILKIEELLPEDPSDTVKKIVEDGCDLILNGEDMDVFSHVFDVTCLAVERQLTAEANQKAMEDLLKQTEEELTAANESITELNIIIESKDATIAEKQTALETATEQLNTAKSNLETAKANLEMAKAKVMELEGTISEQDEELKQAIQNLEDMQDALDEMTENYNTASAALALAQKNLEDTTVALNEAKAANEQLQKDLVATNESIAELNNTIKSKDATIAEKQAALDTATEQLNTAKAELETTKTNLETAKAKVTELEGTISEQDEALKQASQSLKDTQEALTKAEQDIQDLQAEIDRLKALLDDDPQSKEKIGDVNCDGLVDMKDVLLLRKYLVGTENVDNVKTADCNADGVVDMKDVLMLRKYLAGIIETLDV